MPFEIHNFENREYVEEANRLKELIAEIADIKKKRVIDKYWGIERAILLFLLKNYEFGFTKEEIIKFVAEGKDLADEYPNLKFVGGKFSKKDVREELEKIKSNCSELDVGIFHVEYYHV